MRIVIAGDHGGYDLKKELKEYLERTCHQVQDIGTHNQDSVDYPDYAITAAGIVAVGGADFGIVICKTGIGMSIAANKVSGIRAALCVNTRMAELSRRHNNANILALGAVNQTFEEAWFMVEVFISTAFENGRHTQRVNKISDYERICSEKTISGFQSG